MEQQAEIQRLADEQEKHKKQGKTDRYKQELEAQLAERNKKVQLETQIQRDPKDQKILSEDYRRFEQKEYDRINNGRQRTKQIMQENQYLLQRKSDAKHELHQQDKDVFNRQALEDRLHAEKTAEERKRWQDWQRESLKYDYEEQIKRKENLQRMEREKERIYADQFKNTVENYEYQHNKTLEDRRRKNEEVLHHQETTVIPDLNERRKKEAENTMRQQFENTEKQTLMKELSRLNKKYNAERETGDVLKLQMDIKKRDRMTHQREEENYKNYVDNTINMLGERDRKAAEERQKFRDQYAKELESQIKEHSQKEKVMYNEMDERSLTLNQKGLMAYETAQRDPSLFKLPGIDREPERENFARYARNKKTNKVGSEMTLSHRHGPMSDSQSITGGRIFGNNAQISTLPYGQKITKEAPKTSEEYGTRGRRSSRGVMSPPNIHNDSNNYQNDEPTGLSKYRSMANLDSHKQEFDKNKSNEIGVIRVKNSNLLSPRGNNEEPEYDPTKRDNVQKRPIPNEMRKSLTNLGSYTDRKEVHFNAPQTTQSPQRISKIDKIRNAPRSLLDIDNMLNKQVLGTMRAGNFNISRDINAYGAASSHISNMPNSKGYMTDRQ